MKYIILISLFIIGIGLRIVFREPNIVKDLASIRKLEPGHIRYKSPREVEAERELGLNPYTYDGPNVIKE